MSDRSPGGDPITPDGWSPSTPAPPPERPVVRPTTTGGDGDRPPPTIASLGGAVAAVLLVFALSLYLSSVDGDQRRMVGIVLSLGFTVAGIAITWLAQGRRMATAGLGLSALAVVPLVFQLFVDPDDPGAIETASDFTGTATGVLVVLALLWGAAYLLGPGRRYGLYLGGALLAIWLVAVVQVVDGPLGQITNAFDETIVVNSPAFEPVDPYGEVTEDPFDDTDGFTIEDEYSFDTSDEFDDEDEYTLDVDVDDPSTELGVVSLLFGGGYLALAALRDRRGDARTATPALAVALPVLHLAVIFLSGELKESGSGVLAIVLGAVLMWVGSRGERRFTSWAGVYAVAMGLILIVGDIAPDSETTAATIFLVLGLAIAGGLYALEARGPGAGRPEPPGTNPF